MSDKKNGSVRKESQKSASSKSAQSGQFRSPSDRAGAIKGKVPPVSTSNKKK